MEEGGARGKMVLRDPPPGPCGDGSPRVSPPLRGGSPHAVRIENLIFSSDSISARSEQHPAGRLRLPGITARYRLCRGARRGGTEGTQSAPHTVTQPGWAPRHGSPHARGEEGMRGWDDPRAGISPWLQHPWGYSLL